MKSIQLLYLTGFRMNYYVWWEGGGGVSRLWNDRCNCFDKVIIFTQDVELIRTEQEKVSTVSSYFVPFVSLRTITSWSHLFSPGRRMRTTVPRWYHIGFKGSGSWTLHGFTFLGWYYVVTGCRVERGWWPKRVEVVCLKSHSFAKRLKHAAEYCGPLIVYAKFLGNCMSREDFLNFVYYRDTWSVRKAFFCNELWEIVRDNDVIMSAQDEQVRGHLRRTHIWYFVLN